ncbi:MAG: AAA family ATPase [Planctomycetota bacterium]
MFQRRLYEGLLNAHFRTHRQMAFVTGPRQVGKTTTCRSLADVYLSWDDANQRQHVLGGPDVIAKLLDLEKPRERPPVVVFDELHKHRRWRDFLKGFFDVHGEKARVLVTGSSRLGLLRRGDSLLGRYFHYRMHPLTIGELIDPSPPDKTLVRPPRALPDPEIEALWTHGGFPEPFLKRDAEFSTLWRRQRRELVLREDARELTRVADLGTLEVLGNMLHDRSSGQLVLSNLASDLGVSAPTAKAWVDTLAALYVGFLVRPWFRNVTKSLRKEPKWYLRDWSGIADDGARAETFVACHLLKAVETWEDRGLGEFELRYLRDKEKREVDFVVVRDRKPWFMVEVKLSDEALSPALSHFQKETGAAHAFQVVVNAPFVATDPFARKDPIVLPARTLLSQLP